MRRSDQNPLITRLDIRCPLPELTDVTSVFNPGAIRIDDQTRLLLRVQNRGRETFLLRADSVGNDNFEFASSPAEVSGIDALERRIFHIYDPRIVVIENSMYISLAVDTDEGCYAIVTKSNDLQSLEYIGRMWSGEARNGVLFPERVNGRYLGLVRPNTASKSDEPASGSTIFLVESEDLCNWHSVGPVMQGRPHYWDELIGSGPPPIKTRQGWLHIYHGVATHFSSVNIYQAGVCLLDLKDPSQVLSRGRYNILEPREPYELVGQVPNVVFPTGAIVQQFDSEGFAEEPSPVDIYYGAADTVVAKATTSVRELIDHCFDGSRR